MKTIMTTCDSEIRKEFGVVMRMNDIFIVIVPCSHHGLQISRMRTQETVVHENYEKKEKHNNSYGQD